MDFKIINEATAPALADWETASLGKCDELLNSGSIQEVCVLIGECQSTFRSKDSKARLLEMTKEVLSLVDDYLKSESENLNHLTTSLRNSDFTYEDPRAVSPEVSSAVIKRNLDRSETNIQCAIGVLSEVDIILRHVDGIDKIFSFTRFNPGPAFSEFGATCQAVYDFLTSHAGEFRGSFKIVINSMTSEFKELSLAKEKGQEVQSELEDLARRCWSVFEQSRFIEERSSWTLGKDVRGSLRYLSRLFEKNHSIIIKLPTLDINGQEVK